MSRRMTRGVVAGVAFSLAVAAGFSSGSATAAESDGARPADAAAEHTAQVVAAAAPADSTVVSNERVPASADDDGATLQAGVAVLPADGQGVVVADQGSVTIGLPEELPVDSAQVTDDGTVVYPGADDQGAAVAVASTSDSVALQVVLPDASAPTRYTFDIGGATPVLAEDGSVELLDADGALVGLAGAPWATDAHGQPVATHYEVDGRSLVQVVAPEGAVFPVVADPDFIFVAKCSAAIALFAAENAAMIGKFWRVFKSTKQLIKLFKDIRKMSKGSKISYLKSKLGSIASEMSGLGDLVSRCTP